MAPRRCSRASSTGHRFFGNSAGKERARRAALALLDPHAGAAAVDVAVVARTPREKHDFQYNWSSPHESLPKNS